MHVAELVRALRRDLEVVRALLRRSARRGGNVRATRRPPSSTGATPRSPRSASTCRSPRTSRAPTSCTRTPGTRTAPGHREAAARHPARRDRAQPRAAAAVEGRAARRRLPGLVAGSSSTAFEAADAVIAVSDGMRRDILRSYPVDRPASVSTSCYNGIDLDRWKPNRRSRTSRDRSASTPTALGRLRRAHHAAEGPAVPAARGARCCRPTCSSCSARARPTPPEILAEVQPGSSTSCSAERDGVVWIDRHLPRNELSALLTAATAFVCPSVYEPLGIVNLEAMACGAARRRHRDRRHPRGRRRRRHRALVPIEQADDGTGTPLDPDALRRRPRRGAHARSSAIPPRARAMGEAGRRRAEDALRLGRDRRAHARASTTGARWLSVTPSRGDRTTESADRSALRVPIAWVMASTVLQFCDVSVVRDGNPILDSVTWTVDSDERWVILGPNGAGKTTLLQIAAAAMHPT